MYTTRYEYLILTEFTVQRRTNVVADNAIRKRRVISIIYTRVEIRLRRRRDIIITNIDGYLLHFVGNEFRTRVFVSAASRFFFEIDRSKTVTRTISISKKSLDRF